MLIRATLATFALWALVGQMAPTSRPPDVVTPPVADLAKIRAEVDALIAASGAEVAVAWRPLNSTKGEEILIRPDLRFHAASTMKVPVMIELFRQVENGLRKLDDKVLVTNQFTSIFDGSPYVLSATEDSDGEMYKAMGKQLSLRALVDASITASSNLATNILIEHLRAANVQATVDTMGAVGMQVMRGVED
ncbi:MAG: hypothetical protein EXQ49_04660 [Acidobacteria bacterium]|nr:hypothetical protein [Acidobacteriota bacterium]